MKNSSDRAFISDMTILALVEPEMFNENSECMNDYANDTKADFDLMYILLDEAIARDDKEEIKDLRRDIQKAKTRIRINRKLNEENKSVKDLLTT